VRQPPKPQTADLSMDLTLGLQRLREHAHRGVRPNRELVLLCDRLIDRIGVQGIKAEADE
jgi:hypothetical protein